MQLINPPTAYQLAQALQAVGDIASCDGRAGFMNALSGESLSCLMCVLAHVAEEIDARDQLIASSAKPPS